MSKVDANQGIIYNLLATDHDALTKVAETVESMVRESERSAGKLAKMVGQSQRTKARIADASDHLEQRLNSGAELLR